MLQVRRFLGLGAISLALCSCTKSDDRHRILAEFETFSIEETRGGTVFATVPTPVSLKLQTDTNQEGEVILEGSGPKYVDVSLDRENSVILIYFCAGTVKSFTPLVHDGERWWGIQPVTVPFEIDPDKSMGCDGHRSYILTAQPSPSL